MENKSEAWQEYENWLNHHRQSAYAEKDKATDFVTSKLRTPEREAAYMAARPDVLEAKMQGNFGGDAFSHYMQHGRGEGESYVRPLEPLHQRNAIGAAAPADIGRYIHPLTDHIYSSDFGNYMNDLNQKITQWANANNWQGRGDWSVNEVTTLLRGQDLGQIAQTIGLI